MVEERKHNLLRTVSNEDRDVSDSDPNTIESTLTDMNMHRMGSSEMD